jgi:hypothetical protein
MDEQQQQAIEQQIEHERAARLKAADAIGEAFAWAFAAARAFPENIGVQGWQAGATLILRYDEHEGALVLGVRAADGSSHILHAVSADRKDPAIFGRPLDSLLRAALEAVPQPSANPPI